MTDSVTEWALIKNKEVVNMIVVGDNPKGFIQECLHGNHHSGEYDDAVEVTSMGDKKPGIGWAHKGDGKFAAPPPPVPDAQAGV